jgi:transcriptional regulator of acetoin/glycerol metabolism
VDLLEKHQGNISAIGRELGKERVQIHRWLKRHGLNADDYRP